MSRLDGIDYRLPLSMAAVVSAAVFAVVTAILIITPLLRSSLHRQGKTGIGWGVERR